MPFKYFNAFGIARVNKKGLQKSAVSKKPKIKASGPFKLKSRGYGAKTSRRAEHIQA